MSKVLVKILTEIGLNEKQAKVYLAVLELGGSKVTEIAALSKVHRVTVYDILKSLMEKGLVSSI